MSKVIEIRREVEVYAGEKGHVCIKQNSYPDNDSIIIVHSDDVAKLIQYLQ